jgi:hypothetical protein
MSEAPRIYPTFRYRDAAKMIDWWKEPSVSRRTFDTWTAIMSPTPS